MYKISLPKNIYENKNDAGDVTTSYGNGKDVNAHNNDEYENNTEALKTLRNCGGHKCTGR